MSPVQQATVEANGDSWCTSPDTSVSNGPYMITDWTLRAHRADQEPQLCWRLGQPKIVSDTITPLLLEDSSASYAAYNSGEAQLIKDMPTMRSPA